MDDAMMVTIRSEYTSCATWYNGTHLVRCEVDDYSGNEYLYNADGRMLARYSDIMGWTEEDGCSPVTVVFHD